MKRLLLSTALCAGMAAPAFAAASASAIDWREGDVADAFSEAKRSDRPVLLYWGARWCPPCARLKATVFQDPAFIAETRSFVPVHLDGDAKGAQLWGQRYAIVGYPTIIILKPDGVEITRLAGFVDPAALAGVLHATVARQMTAQQLVDRVRTDPAHLSADDWTLLAEYDWFDNKSVMQDPVQVTALLDRLAGAAPDQRLARQFTLLALTAPSQMADSDTLIPPAPPEAGKIAAMLSGMLADPAEVRANVGTLSAFGAPLIKLVPDAASREHLRRQLVAALDRAAADPSLPIDDRMNTIAAAIAFDKPPTGPAPGPLLASVHARVSAADAAAHSPMERQSVILDASVLLDAAGDRPGAEQLLQAELSRSATPFYYMSHLSTLAEEDGDRHAALAWARRAADTSQGRVSRVAWAVRYTKTVIRLSPDDAAEVERSADATVDELAHVTDDYHDRVTRSMRDWAVALRGWSEAHHAAAVLSRVDARLQPVCGQQSDAQSASSCNGLLARS